MQFDLSGKIAVVTGASSGMGRSIAVTYAQHGADVVITGRNTERLERVADQIREAGRTAHVVVADLFEPAQAALPVAAALETFGQLDILVNNAGGAGVYVEGGSSPLCDTPYEAVEQLFMLNTFAPFVTTKAAALHMRERRKGSIINVTSVSAHNPGPEVHAYGAAKAALHAWTVAWARDLGQYGIRVNEIIPGAVETANLVNRIASPEGRALMESNPLGRLGQPEDIAAAALYFGSDESAWVSSASLRVSGGI